MKNQKGFTLIELIITVTIFIIFANMLAMSASSNTKRKLDSACIELQSDIRYAQRLSVIEGRSYEVYFDLRNNLYYISREGEEALSIVKVKEKKFDNGISVIYTNAASNTVKYTPTGTTGDACKITLKNSDYIVNLTVNLGSGRIEIKQFTKL